MAEDEDLRSDAGLNDTDIQTNVYEGGFKSWECSTDLAKLLLDRGPRKDIDDLCRVDQVIEVRCLDRGSKPLRPKYKQGLTSFNSLVAELLFPRLSSSNMPSSPASRSTSPWRTITSPCSAL